uniref:Uncharacterized protein n=1 Tax=Aplanochytrium stocchinoi TaxID=215587 RepID=A0A7S3PQF9_9STRA|mmetsp:Transcript_130/g.211  ORF Transcript_130/g.211 Transcript_130/m.211 type:complete len:271 (+) Transcript_130:466-1278(+)|eukprot:CAMPEP_0204835036 /NCGR_PEP_ID=MMETSP1346-20131115/21537_1 /ASSEMBLY_ACC=CAM_ASM_000771 /TAXON_ID=215587 /ORGANISM="Aplanochytrium stocchinoi, Strain GSBS06" /LENGTH=270 /DNA_ID=CAMNT_0051968735 /DNA_START=460 /DNA_END=1272 /DNA_ORIENTATION=-
MANDNQILQMVRALADFHNNRTPINIPQYSGFHTTEGAFSNDAAKEAMQLSGVHILNPMQSCIDSFFDSATALPTLVISDLGSIGTRICEKILQQQWKDTIQTLDLSSIRLRGTDVEMLQSLQSLHTLVLRDNNISNVDCLCHPFFPKLMALDLSYNQVGFQGFRKLMCNNLIYLNLTGNNIGVGEMCGQHWKKLCEHLEPWLHRNLNTVKLLREVNISGNGLDYEFVSDVLRFVFNDRGSIGLKVLDISKNSQIENFKPEEYAPVIVTI